MYLKNFCAIGALAVLTTVNMAFAQEAPVPAPQPLETPTQSDTQPEVRSAQFQDWFYRCVDVKAADGSTVPNCEVAQVAQVKQGDKDVNVLTLAIAKTAPDPAKKQAGGLLLTALVPLNVFLPSGFMIDVDGTSVSESGYPPRYNQHQHLAAGDSRSAACAFRTVQNPGRTCSGDGDSGDANRPAGGQV